MSARQCKLVVIAKQEPVPLAKGDRAHNPNQIALAAINKGKKYPYSSERQNTREQRKRAAFNVRMDAKMNKIIAEAAE